jgi:polysaccharide biosynthesis protein PslG
LRCTGFFRTSIVALALLGFVVAGAYASQPLSPAAVPAGFVGVNLDGPMFPTDPGINMAQQMDVMVASGVESVRISLDWRSIEPYPSWSDVPTSQRSEFEDVDGLPLRLASVDQFVVTAAQHGISVLPVVLDAPPWDSKSQRGIAAAHTPKSDAPYGTFLKALIARYGPAGSLWQSHSPKLPIRMWEVWNEPDISGYWSIQPFERTYAQLLQVAHAAIKKADPGAKVVLAGMVNASWTYIAQLYRIRGVRDLFDVVAVHPYTRLPNGVLQILTNVRQVMNAAGDAHKPIIADEVGWNSSRGKSPNHFGIETTESGQANNLGKLLPMLAANRKRLDLIGFDYYDWAGADDTGGPEFDFAGLFQYRNGQFTAKPVFGVFSRDSLALEHCRVKGSVATSCSKPS